MGSGIFIGGSGDSLYTSRMQARAIDTCRIKHLAQRSRMVIIPLLLLSLLAGKVGGERRLRSDAGVKVA